MNSCLKHRRFLAVASVLAFSGFSAEGASSNNTSGPPRVRSVVRADARGRLVRTVVVSPRLIPASAVEPGDVTAPSIRGNAEIPALVEAAARKYDVDPLLVHSVIQVESNYNPYAVSPKGAQGLMQLMPGTARRFGVSNSFDPAENIDGGVRYLKYLSSLFPQDPRLAIAAYNAGEGAVWKYNFQIPPYRETEHYVSRVSERYGKARRKAQEAKAPAAEETPDSAKASAPAAPAYASVQAYVDANGRLHLRTGSDGTSTP